MTSSSTPLPMPCKICSFISGSEKIKFLGLYTPCVQGQHHNLHISSLIYCPLRLYLEVTPTILFAASCISSRTTLAWFHLKLVLQLLCVLQMNLPNRFTRRLQIRNIGCSIWNKCEKNICQCIYCIQQSSYTSMHSLIIFGGEQR